MPEPKDPQFEEFKKEQDVIHTILKALEKLPLARRREIWQNISRAFSGKTE